MQKYQDLMDEIGRLTKIAERKRKQEIGAVVKRIRADIQHYSLTAADLGFKTSYGSVAASERGKRAKSSGRPTSGTTSSPRKKVPPIYHDGQGNFWTGRGLRPKWVNEALIGGATLESLRISHGPAPSREG